MAALPPEHRRKVAARRPRGPVERIRPQPEPVHRQAAARSPPGEAPAVAASSEQAVVRVPEVVRAPGLAAMLPGRAEAQLRAARRTARVERPRTPAAQEEKDR